MRLTDSLTESLTLSRFGRWDTEAMTTRTQQRTTPRWVLAFLAALVAVLATILSSATASAATQSVAEARVGAHNVAVEVLVEPPEHIAAGQRLGKDLAEPETAVATGVAANGGEDVARVGRWMSQSEHEAMLDTGRVQPGRFSPHTDVSYPASPTAFSPTNPLTSRYVEFNVPRDSLVQGGKEGWAHIPGPDSIFSRLAVNRGGVPFEYPDAGDIQWIASWIG